MKTLIYFIVVFREPLTNKTCYEGEPISLECVVEGGKKPSKWYKGEEAVLSDNIRDDSKDQTYKLSILHATREDAGVYTVKIGNKITDVRLDVIGKNLYTELHTYQIYGMRVVNFVFLNASFNTASSVYSLHTEMVHLDLCDR